MSVLARRLPQVFGLTLVWVALWGVVSVKIVVGGLLVGFVVTLLFPTPILEPMPFRPWPVLRLAGFLLVDLVLSGFAVGWEILRHGPRARSGIVAVPMLTRSGRVAAMVAGGVALTPGSVVMQLDQRRRVWYVYSLGMASPDDARRVRAQVLRLQWRVIAAFGPPDELELARTTTADRPAPREGSP